MVLQLDFCSWVWARWISKFLLLYLVTNVVYSFSNSLTILSVTLKMNKRNMRTFRSIDFSCSNRSYMLTSFSTLMALSFLIRHAWLVNFYPLLYSYHILSIFHYRNLCLILLVLLYVIGNFYWHFKAMSNVPNCLASNPRCNRSSECSVLT